MNKRHVLLGFEVDNIDFTKKIRRLLEKDNYDIQDISIRNSKTGIKTYLENNECCDTLILREVVDRTTKFNVEDIKFILDDIPINRVINVIYLCGPEHKGTDLMKELYSLGVMCALFYNVTTWDIVQLIEKPRSKKSARIYYGIETGIVMSTTLSSLQVEDKLRHLLDGSESELGKRYLDCVVQMNRQQNIQFIKHINTRYNEVLNKLVNTLEFDIAKRAMAQSDDKGNIIIDIKMDTELNLKKIAVTSNKKINKKTKKPTVASRSSDEQFVEAEKKSKKPGIFARLFKRRKEPASLIEDNKSDQFIDYGDDIIEAINVEPTIVKDIYNAVDVDIIIDCIEEERSHQVKQDMNVSERKVIYEEKAQSTSTKEPDQSTCKRLLQFI